MRFFPIIYSVLLMGCTSVKLTEVKQLPASEFSKKLVEVKANVWHAYQRSCTQNGELYQWQAGRWIELKNEFNPAESATPYFLDGHFSQQTMWSEGCDVIECRRAYPYIRFDLAEYKKIGEKPNPEYKGNMQVEQGSPIPKQIPDFKTKLLSGRFKATYIYYFDSDCNHRAAQEIEFEVP